MGMYNVLLVRERCGVCDVEIDRRVQFAWGDTWLHEYAVGDPLAWGGNAIGEPGVHHVAVDAAAEGCPICGAEGPEGEVFVERDVLIGWRPYPTASTER